MKSLLPGMAKRDTWSAVGCAAVLPGFPALLTASPKPVSWSCARVRTGRCLIFSGPTPGARSCAEVQGLGVLGSTPAARSCAGVLGFRVQGFKGPRQAHAHVQGVRGLEFRVFRVHARRTLMCRTGMPKKGGRKKKGT
eukprot:50453-Chlamydomonas_euryale.AAC.1